MIGLKENHIGKLLGSVGFVDEFSCSISVDSPGSEDSLHFWLRLRVNRSCRLDVNWFRLASSLALIHHHEKEESFIIARIVHKKEWKHHIGSENRSWSLRLHGHHQNEQVHGRVVIAVIQEKEREHHIEVVVESFIRQLADCDSLVIVMVCVFPSPPPPAL